MGILLLIGTILFAYGPAFSAVVILAKKRPYLFLVSLIAALFSILSIFLSGIVYTIWNIFSVCVPKPNTFIMMFVLIGIEELIRPLYFMLLNFLCHKLNQVNVDIHIDHPTETFKFAVAGGLGASIVSSAFISLISLTSSGTPGTYVIENSSLNIFVLTSVQTFMIHFNVLAWYYICLYGYCHDKYFYYLIVFAWHVAHGLSFGFRALPNGFLYQLLFMTLETLLSIATVVLVVKRTIFPSLPKRS